MAAPAKPARRFSGLILLAAAGISVGAFGSIPQDGSLHLLAVLASLLPLQLAALYWATAAAPTKGRGLDRTVAVERTTQ